MYFVEYFVVNVYFFKLGLQVFRWEVESQIFGYCGSKEPPY